eukprot:gene13859-15307_t
MPTSKSRKCRLIAKQKRREKLAIKMKGKLGHNVMHCRTLQKNSSISKAIASIVECMKDVTNASNGRDVERNNMIIEDEYQIKEHCLLLDNNTDKQLKAADNEGKHLELQQNTDNLPKMVHENDSFKSRSQTAIDLDFISKSYSEGAGGIIKGERKTFMLRKIFTFFDVSQVVRLPLSMMKAFCQKIKTISFGANASLASDAKLIDKLKQRVEHIEKEIEILKDSLNNKCKNCNTVVVKGAKNDSSTQLMPHFAPPPPPPPPPQLLIARAGSKDNCQKRQQTKIKEINQTSTDVRVTKDQLLKVKLKRVSFGSCKKESQNLDPPVITLQDIRNVKLKRRPLDKENATPLRDISNDGVGGRPLLSMDKRTPLSRYNLRKTLKKVNMLRSPGGTPLVKAKIECGQGMTPLLTGALRRKFKNVNPPSAEDSPLDFGDL